MRKKIAGLLMAVLLILNSAICFADSATAAAKTSADFTDLKDLDAATKAKFDALISAGIFDGVSDTTFGLKDEMNRAQFAKVAALIIGLDVNKDLMTSSFSDVNPDDPANGYALPYIEALKAAGITVGDGEGTYNPAGKVTKEQLATFLVRILGKDADAKAKTGSDTTVTDWAQGYVALALELKLLPSGSDGKFGGQANATRDQLLTGAYEAKEQYVVQVDKKNKEEEEKKKEEEEKKKQEEEKKKQEEQSWSPAPPSVQATVKTPTALPAGGAVTSGTQVTLTSATVSAAVYYTTDLSEPTTSSTPYTEPIIITSSTTIKAIAVKTGSTNSSVARFEYTVTMPILLPDSISPLTEGQPYTGSVAKQSGGTGAVTYAVTSGALPAGLTLNPSTGVITGTPSVSGAYNFTISATDSATPPATVTMQYTDTITPASSKTPLELINEASASGSWTGINETTFANAGVTGVTSENLTYVQDYLEVGATTRTSAQVQAIVNEVRAGLALTEISNYFTVPDWPKPSATTFAVAGVTGVTADNLDDILIAIEDAYHLMRGPFDPPFSITSRDDLQQVVEDWAAQNGLT